MANEIAKTPGATALKTLMSPAFKQQMALALPKTLTADRLTRIVMTEFRNNPKLYQCSTASIFGAVMQCAALGLEPGSALGSCYMIPFSNWNPATKTTEMVAQVVIGYRGMLDLARRSGQIESIFSYVVHEGDHFVYQLGLSPTIEHNPDPDCEDNPITHVYAVAKLKGGGYQFEVMSRKQVDKIRNSTQAFRYANSKGKPPSGPWVDYYEEMAKKTVIRRLFKYLPISIEMARAQEIEDRAELGEVTTKDDVLKSFGIIDENIDDAIPTEEHSSSENLLEELKATKTA